MLEQIRTVDGENLLPLPADALAVIGLQPSDHQVEVTVVGPSLVVQPLPDEQPTESEFVEVLQKVVAKRRNAYQELA